MQSGSHVSDAAVHHGDSKAAVAACVRSNPGLPAPHCFPVPGASQHGQPEPDDPRRPRPHPEDVWRRATDFMDPRGTASPHRRAGGVEGDRGPDGQEVGHHAPKGGQRVEQGKPEKSGLGPPCADQLAAQCGPQCHDSGDPEGGHGEIPDGDCGRGQRPHGLRQVRWEDLPRCEDQRGKLLPVGEDHIPGREYVNLPEEVRGVSPPEEEDPYQVQPQEDGRESRLCGPEGEDRGGSHTATEELPGKLLDRGHGHPAHATGGRADCRGQGAEGGEGGGRPEEDCREVRCDDGCEQPGLAMSQVAANALAYKSQLVVPNMFEDLTGNSRLELMEIACEPDSLLASAVQARTGRSDAACRSSLWCGHDLATSAGLSRVLEQIRVLRPKRVWVSPPCDPYSPLQNFNQRTPAQVQDLKHKRATAQRIYESTLEIVKVCLQLGIHATVELAERCEAWRLPVFQKLRFEMGLHTAVTKGCSVG